MLVSGSGAPFHVTPDIAGGVAGAWPGKSAGLTAREAEVVALITRGFSNEQIAKHTYITINTLKSYIRSAYRKMGVKSRAQAVRWGIEHGAESSLPPDPQATSGSSR